jgi:YD repeat-containing protein
MVAIVAGNGLGIFNASNNVLGSLGVLGDGLLGQTGGQSYVNAATGNLVLQFADEGLAGQGTDLAALRTYNSLGTMSDGLGSGWTQDGERSVAFGSGTLNAAGSTVTRTDGDGHVTAFTWNASLGMYASGEGSGALDTLQRVTLGTGGSATHQWVFTDGSTRQVERYADSTTNTVKGQLLSQMDASGNEIDYGYTGSLLTSITDHGSGQKIQLVYGTAPGSNLQRLLQLNTFSLTTDANNRATSTVGAALSQVSYAYDSMGRLTSVSTDLTPSNTTDNAVYTTSYTYASATSQLIASVSQSDGSSVSFAYDGSGRVKSVTDASGTQTFAYSVGTKIINGTPATSTTITNATGRVWTYYYDSNSDADAQQLLEIDSPATADGPAPVTQFSYDANGNVSEITQGSYPNGSTALTISSQVIYKYDASGNRILERDSLGNTITRTFDAANQLLTETHYLTPDPNGLNPGSTAVNAGSPQTTYYVYDSGERLRFTVSAEGRVTEYRYESGGYGNLTRSISYAAQRFSGTLSIGSPPSEAALASWAASQDQTQTEQAQYTYDLRGNLASRTDYSTVNSGGSGVLDSAATVTNYIYDTYGQLLQTIQVHSAQTNPNAVLTSYAYDGLGRQTTRVDASGTETTTYNDAQHQIVVSNSSTGLSQVSAFDSRGRLVSVTQTDLNSSGPSATRETEYLYDADGQLIATQSVTGTDPTTHQEIIGSRSFRFYDADGRLAYTVDATGDVTVFSYDSAGRVTAQTSYANTISATALNGWVTATVVTNTATSPPTFTTNYTINKSALSVGAIGSTGSDVAANSADRTTKFVYDLGGRLVAEIDAANVTTTTNYDGDSHVTKQQIGSRVTQYFYDADGNQVGVLDPLGYLTESKYDAAGRLVESDRYTTRSPGAPDSSAPVFVGASNQTLTAGQFFSYRIPAYDADGDQLIFKAVGTLPSWLTLNTDAGGVTLSGTPPATLTTYSVTLLADDGRGTASSTATATVQLTVGNAPPSWAALPSVQVVSNTANYALVLPAATDDISTQAQLKYSINAALLPPGLSFNAATRTISGTPTTAGSYVITAQVTDSGTPPLSTTRTFVLQVTNVGPSWSMGATVAPAAVRGQGYNFALPGAVDPENQNLSYRLVSGPAWLTLNSSSAPTLSGTPPLTTAAVGSQPVVLEATDSFGETVRLSFSVNVVNLPPTFSAAPANISVLAGGTVNYTPPVARDPEGLPITYSYTGTLPSGLTFNASTGQITGTTHITDVNNYPITLIASTGEPGDSVAAQISINLLNTAPTYQGGIADSSALYFNWADIHVPFNAFGDVNGDHLTFSVPGAIPSLRPVDNSGSGIYFAVSGSGYTLSVLDNNPADINGTVIPVTVVATDSHGATATHVVNVTIVSQLPPPGSPPPHLPPPGPGPKPPGGPPVITRVVQAPPSSSVPAAPAPVLVQAPAATASAMPPAPRPLSISPVVDVLAQWRPTDTTDALRSFYFYDGEGRQTGVVDQNGFLTATVYNEQTNTQQTVRYFTPVTVAVGGANADTLSSLEGRAGAAETSTTQFDAFNRVSGVTGVDGSITQNTYDQASRLIRQVSAVGTSDQQSTRTVYDAFGDVTGILGGVGDATLPVAATAAQINTALANYGSQFKYDSLGNLISEVDADGVDTNGNVTRFFYDAEGRLTQTVNALGDVSEKTYDAFGDVQGTRNYSSILSTTQLAALTGGSNGALTPLLKPSATADQITSASYDARGLLTQSVDALGFTTSFSYDNYGQLIDETRTIAKAAGTKAANTTTTEFDYDLDGHIISQTADVGGLNNNTQTSYDAYGRVIQSVDATGKVTQTRYQETAAGSVVTIKDPLNRSTTTTYDALNRVVSQVDALGRTTQYVYNDSNRSIALTLGYGTADAVTVNTYLTRNGQTASVVDGRGNTTNYFYNADGQLTKVTDALNNDVSKDAYDNSGRLLSTTDANGTLTQLSYDALNRVVKRVVDPSKTGHTGLNLTTQYGFNQFGQELTVTEGAGTAGSKVTSFRYDLDGNLTQVIVDPGTGALQLATSYSYDGLGDVLTVSQGTLSAGNQQVTQFVFDKLGRRIAQIDAPSSVLGAGAANERDLTTTFKYDADGRVTRSIDPDGNSTWFVYDADGELTNTVNALGEVSENTYDAAGQLVQTRQYATAVDTSKFGDAPTSVGAIASASDQRSYFVYDNDGRQVYSLQATDGTHWTLSQRIYDANGNVIETRTYDKAVPDSWVSSNTASGTAPISAAQVATELSSLGYTSDGALNLSQRTRFAFDADNRLRFTVDALGDVSELTYDKAGNVTQAVRFAAVPTLSAYTESAISAAVDGTAPNNLRADPNNQVTNFSYDAAGRLHYTVQVLASDGKGNATSQLVTELDYDALGRLVQRTAYATVFGAISDPGQTSSSDYSAANIAAFLTGKSSVQDRTSAFVYDAAGRQIYAVQVLTDSTGKTTQLITKQTYDAMGHVLQSTAYSTPMTLSDYQKTTLDNAVATNASAADRTTSFVYDAEGRVRFVVAPDNTLSETVYDTAGRVREQRHFDLTVSASTPLTEAALVGRRANRQVGDGVTRGQKFTYDAAGELLTTTDALGNVQTNTYDKLGNLASSTDGRGAKWTYGYDLLGRLVDTFSPQVAVQLSNQNAAANLSLDTHITYDTFGNVATRTLAYGTVDAQQTGYVYDTLGRLIQTNLPGYYDPVLGKVTAAQIAGDNSFVRTVQTRYDALGNAVRTQVRTGANTYQYEYSTYDTLGRLSFVVNALNYVTGYSYDAFGDQASVTSYKIKLGSPPGSSNQWNGTAVAAAVAGDTASRTINISYDNLGRKIAVSNPASSAYASYNPNTGTATAYSGSATTKFTYDVFGDLLQQSELVDGSSNQWRNTFYYYDSMGRQTLSVDAMGYQTANTYDTQGDLIQTIEYANAGALGAIGAAPGTPQLSSNDRITAFAYNVDNEQTSVTRFGLDYMALQGNSYVEVHNARSVGTLVSTSSYDADGNLVTQTDALGNTTTTVYNALGQVTSITEPVRLVANANSVDPFLNQVSVTPVTSFVLNAFGQAVTATRTAVVSGSPGAQAAGATLTTHQSYDAGGNLIGSTDANGNVTTLQVDYAGRVIAKTQKVSATLQQLGLTQDQNLPNSSTSLLAGFTQTLQQRFVYDALGQQTDALTVYTDANGLEQTGTHNTYDAFGEITDQLSEMGAASTAPGSLSQVEVAQYTYDNAGRVISRQDSSGLTRFAYNGLGQVVWQQQVGDPTKGDIARNTFVQYDILGRVTLQQQAFYYDPELANDDGDQGAMTSPLILQSFDRWGNVVSRTVGTALMQGLTVFRDNSESATTTYDYNADNQLIAAHLPTATDTFGSHNALTQLNISQATRYDVLGRQVEQQELADIATTPGNDAIQLRTPSYNRYNAIGQLISQTDNAGITTKFAYDANGNRIGTMDANGTVLIDGFDNNGNNISHGILRAPMSTNYVSGTTSTSGVIAWTLDRYVYDQANRRIASTTFTNVGFNAADPLLQFTTLTQFDERNLVRVTYQGAQDFNGTQHPGEVTNVITYDQFGDKLTQTDANQNTQSFNYNTGAYQVGHITSSSVGGLTTNYAYDDFGEVTAESGTDAAGRAFSNTYSYFADGRLLSVDEQEDDGPGILSLDQKSQTSVGYAYTVTGQQKEQDENTTVTDNPGDGTSNILMSDDDTVFTSYDALGRVTDVATPNNQSTSLLKSIHYAYDGLDNRTEIVGSYYDSNHNLNVSTQWFAFDADNRAIIVDGIQQSDGSVATGGAGTAIAYDKDGRRSIARSTVAGANVVDMYQYNDLGYLTEIDESNSGEFNGSQFIKESRQYDDSGRLLNDLFGTMNLQLQRVVVGGGGTTFVQAYNKQVTGITYDDLGNLQSETTHEVSVNGTTNTGLTYSRDHVGNVTGYVVGVQTLQNDGTYSAAVKTDYAYTNVLTQNGYQVQSIHAGGERANNPSKATTDTRNSYDVHGDLLSQNVVNSDVLPNNATVSSAATNFFAYDGQGHVLSKLTSGGTENYFYANGEEVADIGIGALKIAQFSNSYTPVSEVYPAATPGSYVVNSTDTLATIAQTVFGDPSLWYLIADANSLQFGPNDALPATEVGKTYIIPNVVANVQGSSGPFAPFNPTSIGAPQPAALPAPNDTGCSGTERLVATVIIAVGVAAVAAYTGGAAAAALGPLLGTLSGSAAAGTIAAGVVGGAIGAAAGDAAAQGAGDEFGLRSGFSGSELGFAALTGAVGGLANQLGGLVSGPLGGLIKGASNAAGTIGINAARSESFDPYSLIDIALQAGTNAAVGDNGGVPASRGVIDVRKGVEQLTEALLNPLSGILVSDQNRTWANLENAALNNATSLLGDALGRGALTIGATNPATVNKAHVGSGAVAALTPEEEARASGQTADLSDGVPLDVSNGVPFDEGDTVKSQTPVHTLQNAGQSSNDPGSNLVAAQHPGVTPGNAENTFVDIDGGVTVIDPATGQSTYSPPQELDATPDAVSSTPAAAPAAPQVRTTPTTKESATAATADAFVPEGNPQDFVTAFGIASRRPGPDYLELAAANTGKIAINIQDRINLDLGVGLRYPSSFDAEKDFRSEVPRPDGGDLEPLFSGFLAQKALEGDISGTVHLDTRGVNLTPSLPKGDLPGTAQADYHTSAEARQILAHLQSTGPGERKVDVFLQHEEGLTKIGRGSNIAEGAPLTAELAARLPNIISPPHGGGGGGAGTGGAGSPGGVAGGTGTGGGGQAGGAGAAPAPQPEAGFGLAGGIFAAIGIADLIATVISQAAKGDTDGLIHSGVGVAQAVAVTAFLGEAAVPLFLYQGTAAHFEQNRDLFLNNQAPVIQDLFSGSWSDDHPDLARVIGAGIYSASTTLQSIGGSIRDPLEHLGGLLFGPQGSSDADSAQTYLESIPPGI